MKTRYLKPAYSLVALMVCSTLGVARANELQGELRYLRENHPLLKASQFALDAAEQRRKASYSGYFPKITVTADKGNEEITTTSTTDYDRERFGISIEQNLYNGGKTKAGVSVAEIDRRMKDLERKSVSQDVTLEALIAYLQVLRNRLLIGLAEANEVITMTQLDMEQKRVQKGSGIAVDEMQAATRLQIVRERKVFYEQGMRDALAAYEQVFGREPDLNSLQDLDNFTAALPAELEQAIQKGLNGNPKLVLTQLQAERADKTIAVERSAWFPTVDLVASQNREEKVGGIPSKDEDSVVLKFSWNFMTGLETYRRSKAASFDYYESQEREKNTARRTTESIRLSWNQYQKGLERLKLLEDAASSSRQVMEGRKKLRDAGKETVLAVLDAEVEYFGVLANMVNAMVDARLGSYRLLHAVGELDLQAFDLEGGNFQLPVKPVKDVIDQLIGQGQFTPPPPLEPIRLTEPALPVTPSAEDKRAQAMIDAASTGGRSNTIESQAQGLLNLPSPEASIIAEPQIKAEPLAAVTSSEPSLTPELAPVSEPLPQEVPVAESISQEPQAIVSAESTEVTPSALEEASQNTSAAEPLGQETPETVVTAEMLVDDVSKQQGIASENSLAEPSAQVLQQSIETADASNEATQSLEPAPQIGATEVTATEQVSSPVVEPTRLETASTEEKEPELDRPNQREAIATTVLSWATAWSNRAFDEYANFYSNSFLTKDFSGRQNWLEYRKPRIIYKPSISVEVADMQITPLNDRQVEVEFTQFYEGGQLKVRSRKKLLLSNELGGWKILWEGNASDTMLGVESGTREKEERPVDRPTQLAPVSALEGDPVVSVKISNPSPVNELVNLANDLETERTTPASESETLVAPDAAVQETLAQNSATKGSELQSSTSVDTLAQGGTAQDNLTEEAVAQDPVVEEIAVQIPDNIVPVSTEAIQKFLSDWATYWSAKDFEAYAKLYGEEFSNSKFSRLEDWLAYRKPRILGKDSIEVSVEILEVKPLEDGRIEARVIQNYAGNAIKVRSLKRLILDISGSTPKIIWEGNA